MRRDALKSEGVICDSELCNRSPRKPAPDNAIVKNRMNIIIDIILRHIDISKFKFSS